MRSSRRYLRALVVAFGASLLAAVTACSNADSPPIAKPTTAAEQAATIRCDRGLTRIERIGGIEDGFAPTGDEPARIRPARLPNEYLEAISTAQSGAVRVRGYDEMTQDAMLIDHFDVPRDIVSGAIVARIRTTPGSANDIFRFGNLNERDFVNGYGKIETFQPNFPKDAMVPDAGTIDTIVTLPLETLPPNPRARFKGNFIEFLNRADRPDAIDFELEDDTAVDVVILVVCQRPQVAKGTTFTEFRSKFAGPDVSFLSCLLDKTQVPCNPFEGDRLCTAPLPMACYQPGNRPPPGLTKLGLGDGHSSGGEVRATPPVAASIFATRGDADNFCRAQFGEGWRILEYHDGAFAAIATYSNIAPKTRLWVDVSNQRYANCWDREEAR